MNTSKPLLRVATASALAGFLSLLALSALATTPEPPGLFSTLPISSKAVLPQQAIAGKSVAVKINRGRLRSGRFFVSLPGGVSYEAVRELHQDLGNGRSSWVGHASGEPGSTVVLGVSGNAVAGSFSHNGKLFKLEPRANGNHVVSEVKPTVPAPELDPIEVADTISATANSTTSASVAADSSDSVIDVLVAYTPAIQATYGTEGADALIIQAVAEANQAYANSKMTTRLNLVRSVLTNYIEAGDMGTDLSRLRSTTDGFMDELHTLRNNYRADLVSLIANEPQSCGIAYRMTTLSSSFASSGFSVVHHGCATGYYSFAHEIGHNQGAHHDYANATGTAIYPYAYGYQDPLSRLRTIMAYNCPGGCPRVQFFARGDNPLNGVPTGDASSAADAVAIDQTAPTIAAFRQLAAPPPTAPSNLYGSAVSHAQINVNWSDVSGNESGFLVERSIDSTNFTQIASVPANSTSYVDTTLKADTSYSYRSRAWNSSGNSSYSNVASATTKPAPPYIDQTASAEVSGGGKISGNFQSTWSADGLKEIVSEVPSTGVKRQRYSYLEHYWTIVVQPGQSVTLNANIATTATQQSFTFAYSMVNTTLAANRAAWVDMFSVTAANSGARTFALPATLSGPVYISVRDSQRDAGVTTSNSVQIDYLAIQTHTGNL